MLLCGSAFMLKMAKSVQWPRMVVGGGSCTSNQYYRPFSRSEWFSVQNLGNPEPLFRNPRPLWWSRMHFGANPRPLGSGWVGFLLTLLLGCAVFLGRGVHSFGQKWAGFRRVFFGWAVFVSKSPFLSKKPHSRRNPRPLVPGGRFWAVSGFLLSACFCSPELFVEWYSAQLPFWILF